MLVPHKVYDWKGNLIREEMIEMPETPPPEIPKTETQEAVSKLADAFKSGVNSI